MKELIYEVTRLSAIINMAYRTLNVVGPNTNKVNHILLRFYKQSPFPDKPFYDKPTGSKS